LLTACVTGVPHLRIIKGCSKTNNDTEENAHA